MIEWESILCQQYTKIIVYACPTSFWCPVVSLACVLQVGFLLAIADWLVHLLWKQKKDPDNFSIPYLTAVGDLLGTSLLAVGFYVVWLLGDRDSDVGD